MNRTKVIRPSTVAARARAWAIAALVVGVVSLLLNTLGVGGPIRAWLTVAFFVAIPGLPAGLRCLPNGSLAVTVTLALSVTLSVLTAEAMLLSGVWEPLLAQAVLFAVLAPFLLLQLRSSLEVSA